MKKNKTRSYDFDTISGEKNNVVYNPTSTDKEFIKNINYPGEFPYTRGIHSNMYCKISTIYKSDSILKCFYLSFNSG